MIRVSIILACVALLSGCAYGGYGGGAPYNPVYQPTPGQGQYIRPEWLNPTLPPAIPAVDSCRSRLYATLVGQHEGAIFIPGLPGRKRVLKPAYNEGFDYQQNDTFYIEPTLVEVQDYLPGQMLYAPSVKTTADRFSLGPEEEDRLTIELDAEGYVQELRCG